MNLLQCFILKSKTSVLVIALVRPLTALVHWQISHLRFSLSISRVSIQNLDYIYIYIIVEIYHSGRKPLNYDVGLRVGFLFVFCFGFLLLFFFNVIVHLHMKVCGSTAAPIWNKGLQTQTAVQDQDAVFNCTASSAFGERAPSPPKWSKNGERLTKGNIGAQQSCV